MTNHHREAHVEQLIGRRVRDPDGRVLGRLEEMRVEIVDDAPVVTEFHIGPHAFFERIGGFALQLPFFRQLPIGRRQYRVPWDEVDLSDPDHPRTRQPASELRHTRGTRR